MTSLRRKPLPPPDPSLKKCSTGKINRFADLKTEERCEVLSISSPGLVAAFVKMIRVELRESRNKFSLKLSLPEVIQGKKGYQSFEGFFSLASVSKSLSDVFTVVNHSNNKIDKKKMNMLEAEEVE